ncbi:MAG: DEAD/DEAH box helicase [Candidatus Omnitrophica bacterium]|nr:DEAD/DEAH box helicase [Candidatus Omnitrophota bacterium]
MNLKELLVEHSFPQQAIDALTASGITTLHPPQAEAIRKGVLDKKNVVMAVPTAAGKTLISELCMLKSILQHGGKALYIAPLKALASEKYHEFKKKYEALGVKIGIATGDLDSPSKYLDRYQILIATAEKVDSILRSKAGWLINSLSVIVLDEIHFIDDESRGPTLEILTARIKQLKPDIQILALSATISNAQEIAGWLGANLTLSHWRPIPLKEGVYFNDRIMFNNDSIRLVKEEENLDLNKLTMDTLRGQGQVLVFVNSRRSAQAAARELCPSVVSILKSEEKEILNALSREIAEDHSATKVCKKLAEIVKAGCAFHHAGLTPKQRHLIEDHFKRNIIKVICSTPTLAAGVNLPARRAIIRDCKRYASGLGSVYISTAEYKQCAGRAGRPQYDDYGEAVLMAKSLSEQNTLFDRFVLAKPEPVTSKLGSEAALRIHILSSVAAGYVHDINSMFEFLNHTFLSYQRQGADLVGMVGNIFEYLHKNGFLDKSGFKYFTTPFGSITSRLYIDPMTSLVLREGLTKIHTGKSFSTYGLLHMLICCPDSELLSVGKNDYDELESLSQKLEDELIITPNDLPQLQDAYTYYATIKTMSLWSRWIDEDKEESMCDDFNVGPGDIYRHVESAGWLLYAAGMIADLLHYKKMTFELEGLRLRMRYGIKEELLELASLEGVGRIRARILFKHGYHKLSDLKSAAADHLASIKTIGKSLAASIVQQIHHPVAKRFSPKKHSFTQDEIDPAVQSPAEPASEALDVWTD